MRSVIGIVVRVSDVKGRDKKGDRYISPTEQVKVATAYCTGFDVAVFTEQRRRWRDLHRQRRRYGPNPGHERPRLGSAQLGHTPCGTASTPTSGAPFSAASSTV